MHDLTGYHHWFGQLKVKHSHSSSDFMRLAGYCRSQRKVGWKGICELWLLALVYLAPYEIEFALILMMLSISLHIGFYIDFQHHSDLAGPQGSWSAYRLFKPPQKIRPSETTPPTRLFLVSHNHQCASMRVASTLFSTMSSIIFFYLISNWGSNHT